MREMMREWGGALQRENCGWEGSGRIVTGRTGRPGKVPARIRKDKGEFNAYVNYSYSIECLPGRRALTETTTDPE
jgi:hypothetical protein